MVELVFWINGEVLSACRDAIVHAAAILIAHELLKRYFDP